MSELGGLLLIRASDDENVRLAWKTLADLVGVRVTGVWVAGGAVRDMLSGEERPLHDVDVFFGSAGAFARVRSELMDRGAEVVSTIEGKVSMILAGMKYDLIRQVFESPDVLSRNADFTVASGVMDLARGELVGHELFYSDLAARTIRLASEHGSRVPNPARTLPRLVRYLRLGYRASYGELIRLANHIAQAELERDAQERSVGGNLLEVKWNPPFDFEP